MRLYRSLGAAGVPGQVNSFNPVTFPVSIRKIEGYYNGAAPVWLQVWDLLTAPVSGSTPGPGDMAYCMQLFANDGFAFSFEDSSLPIKKSPWLVLSSTETLFTTIGGGGVADMQVFVDQNEMLLDPTAAQNIAPLTVVVGDLTSAVDSLQVWATASGFKNLRQVDWVNAENTKRWLMLFTKDTATNGDKPLLVFEPSILDTFDGNYVNRLTFGDGGLIPRSFATIGATETKGCYLWISSTGDVLTKSTDGGCVIRAIYTPT